MNVGEMMQLPGDQIVYFSQSEYIFAVSLNIMALIGFICDSLIIFALLKQKMTVGSQFILSLCFGDILLTIIVTVYGFRDIAVGGYSAGPIGCIIQTQILVFSEGASILSLMAITLDRYLLIKHQIVISEKQARLVLIAIWGGTPLIGVYLLFGGLYERSVALQPGKTICAIAWWDGSPASLFADYVSLIFVAACCCTMVYAYSSVIFVFREVHNIAGDAQSNVSTDNVMEATGGKSNGDTSLPKSENSAKTKATPAGSAAKKNEKLLLTKCISLTCCFFLCWIPYITNVFIQSSTQTPTSSVVDNCLTFLIGLNTTMNSIMLLKFDLRVRKTIMALFGIKEKVKWKQPVNINLQNMKKGPSAQKHKSGDSLGLDLDE